MVREFNPYPVTQNGKPDQRYRISREWCGYPEPRYVFRYCDKWVAQSLSYSAMVLRATGLRLEHEGALTFVNIPANPE